MALAAALSCASGALVVLGALLGRRVEVVGESMAPTLRPGDRLLYVVLPDMVGLRAGWIVVARDPREPARLLVKRVATRTRGAERVVLSGENAAASTDSATFGALERRAVLGVVWYRYAPAGRVGTLLRCERTRSSAGEGWAPSSVSSES